MTRLMPLLIIVISAPVHAKDIGSGSVTVTTTVTPEMQVIANCVPGQEQSEGCKRAVEELEAEGGGLIIEQNKSGVEKESQQ